jgi:hypothetical protein
LQGESAARVRSRFDRPRGRVSLFAPVNVVPVALLS